MSREEGDSSHSVRDSQEEDPRRTGTSHSELQRPPSRAPGRNRRQPRRGPLINAATPSAHQGDTARSTDAEVGHSRHDVHRGDPPGAEWRRRVRPGGGRRPPLGVPRAGALPDGRAGLHLAGRSAPAGHRHAGHATACTTRSRTLVAAAEVALLAAAGPSLLAAQLLTITEDVGRRLLRASRRRLSKRQRVAGFSSRRSHGGAEARCLGCPLNRGSTSPQPRTGHRSLPDCHRLSSRALSTEPSAWEMVSSLSTSE